MSFEILYKKIAAKHIVIKKEQNLNAFKAALSVLGNPQEKIKFVHIAGTNGKGTASVMTAEILQAAGFKTGLFTSPHLTDATERIKINGKNISKKSFVSCVEKALKAEKEELTFFEILTAAAFYYFAKNKVDYAVIETGLGGELDSTNVVMPEVSIITSIGLDHAYVLGETITKIAAQKAGIIKENIPCVCGILPSKALAVVKRKAKEKHAQLIVAGKFKTNKFLWNKKTTLITLEDSKNFNVNLLGYHTAQNAAIVYAAVKLMGIKEAAVKKGFSNISFPARFDILNKKNNTFIIDGAHNPQAVQSTVELFKQSPYYKGGSGTLVFAAMEDKDYKTMLKILMPHFEKIILTELKLPRAATAKQLLAVLNKTAKQKAVLMPFARALKAAASSARPVLFTGSFYLSGEVYKYL
ncbi:dihydrofolate synthase/folylpolyglutamate synthase [Elusimicrobium posterum]|uniref:bifunctional folylpolyglutamate synthase/dihydrofolate synthase n=1 Tax=Elusimicrobium posterum TaxID=3116653 RepID=UPI003C740ED4